MKQEFAILLLISCKQYAKALELTSHSIYSELNYFFLEICIENKMVNVIDSPSALPSDGKGENRQSSLQTSVENIISAELNLKIKNLFKKRVF